VLGPLLFLAYTNDLLLNINDKVLLFADDTAIYLSLTSSSQSETLQNDLKTLDKWELKWDMEFKPLKCQLIHVTRRKQYTPAKYNLHGILLHSLSSAKYLGVDI
jgi:CRISPR/Cas system Type II protein with McrA/HNH and RuvC-like nuclease domain